MSFLYPLFLVAGLSLAVPILIHLFNLRRYRTVLFPHTRFLKNIQLQSQKQSQLRYRWLLFTRLLFLAALVLAFAQPFFSRKSSTADARRLQVIYLDNSNSMTLKQGAVSLLDRAKEAIRRRLQGSNDRYLLLTNDRPVSYQPLPADRILAALPGIEVSPSARNSDQLFATVQSLMQSELASAADIYYYSDFQKSGFSLSPDAALLKNITLHGVPVQAKEGRNVYIDTAFLTMPVLQSGESNSLVVRSRLAGEASKEAPVLQLSINGQVKSAATLNFNGRSESTDTLSFTVNSAGWQQMALSLNDAAVRFDDTFRITARSAPSLSVLVLNEGQASPYVQAAFRAYNGFRLEQQSLSGVPGDLKQYNLIILNGLTRLDPATGKAFATALQQGQSITVFPGRTRDLAALSEALGFLAQVQAESIDTAAQTVSSLQQGSDLVRDLFDQVPPNVQLPVVNWHYRLRAGLDANQQSVMSFRNGDPFLAQYTPGRGKLYVAAAPADLESGNFPNSYFFVPFLYQMAAQSRGGDVYALTAGRGQAAFLPLATADERRVVHLLGAGVDAIPPQRANGAGLDIFVDQAIRQPGFYSLQAAGSDTAEIALNADRNESVLSAWTPEELRSGWKGGKAEWLDATRAEGRQQASALGSFPLWKLCAILALAALVAETVILTVRRKHPSPAAS